MGLVNYVGGDSTYYGNGWFNFFIKSSGDARYEGAGIFNFYSGGSGNDVFMVTGGLNYFFSSSGNPDILELAADQSHTVFLDWDGGTYDKIDLSRIGVSDLSDLDFSLTAEGVLIEAGDNSVLLKNYYNILQIGADDFYFEEDRLDFETLSSPDSDTDWMPDGYGGLSWSNFAFLETDEAQSESGFLTESGSVAIYNSAGEAAYFWTEDGTNFDFESFHMSAAWEEELYVTVVGYDDGVEVGRAYFSAHNSESQYYELGYQFDSVDAVEFVFAPTSQASIDDLLILF